MGTRRRTRPPEPDGRDRRRGATGDAEAGEMDRFRDAGEELLAAGDEAIRRALSGDSEAFLRANRQQGGQ